MSEEMISLKLEYRAIRRILNAHISQWIKENQCSCWSQKGVKECKHQRLDFHKKEGKRIKKLFDACYRNRSEAFTRALSGRYREYPELAQWCGWIQNG